MPVGEAASGPDRQRVAELLGREPRGNFAVVVRAGGGPVVIRNDPLLDDGTPMPTRYWLVEPVVRRAVDRLEAAGGVKRAEAAVAPAELEDAHRRYAAERDRSVPAGWGGPRPSGGVGGTRRGVKCLHAHYAWFLAGGDDPVGRWVHAELGLSGADPAPGRTGPSPRRGTRAVAAVDCGTNSTRLLVAEPDGRTVERLMTVTRLGAGVDRTGSLSTEGVARTVKVLRRYREVMDGHGVGPVRMTATSAARDASNRDAFFSAAREAVGVEPELLGGDEEGRLSFAGATAELKVGSGPWLVADIGGGSTELAVGRSAGDPEVVVSVDVGCVRVTERFLHHDPPLPGEVSSAAGFVESVLLGARAAHPELASASTLVGLAGTVAAAAALDQRLGAYDRAAVHHHRLGAAGVTALLSELASLDVGARRARAGMEEARADVIVGGLVVLDRILRVFAHDECLTSESDILDGLVASLLGMSRARRG